MSKSEYQTRKEIIDKKLYEAGWNVDNQNQVIKEFGILVEMNNGIRENLTKYEGYHFSDYVLLDKHQNPLAVVEVKKTTKDAQLGREQARQYAYNIKHHYGGKLPFCFYTNGLETYFWDLEQYPPRKVHGFPTRDDLERYDFIRENKKTLEDELINTQISGRDYQIRAIRAVMEAIEKKQRKFLLVMATGTGKTRTCISLIEALMRAGRVQKVLFLVDRVALREQALLAFKEYMPNEPRWPKQGEKSIAKDRRIYVSTYPTMLNIIRSEDNSLSPHFFDLIVTDESHRSIYNTYGEVLDYFDALSLGLTATPTDIIDHNTFQLFNCEDEIPTFAFTYNDALNHTPPFLCDFEVLKIRTKFQDEGISKRTISLEDQKGMILQGKEVEEINFEGNDLEKKVTNRGTNTLIVREFMEECIKDPNGVLPGKTIFFCTSKSHARRIEEIFDSLYPEYNGELARVIVSDDPRVYGKGGLLDQFTNNDMPRVAISVDMLDTGIDIREIVNLVLAKPVFSYTKFWQMIGRGTRLLEPNKIKPWCPVKDIFLIMDCWDNVEYFKLTPKGKELKPKIPLPVRYVGLRLEKIKRAMEKGRTDIANKEILKLKEQIGSLPKKSVIIEDAATALNRIKDDNFWMALTIEKLEFLEKYIKPLFKSVSQTDFKAMKFEKDVLETSIAAFFEVGNKYETLKANIIEQISELPLSVNVVAKEAELIKISQSENFWSNISENDLDKLTEKLAPLMKYREGINTASGIQKFDLKDFLKEKERVEFGPEHESISITKYKEMVEQMILGLIVSNPVLKKIKNGEQISEEEVRELAEILHADRPHITEDILRVVYNNPKAKITQFIRHILGIEKLESFPETVSKAIGDYIKAHSNLSGQQLDFLELLRNFLIDRQKIQKKDLIQAPFTIIHPRGIRGLFSPSEIEEILQLAERLAS